MKHVPNAPSSEVQSCSECVFAWNPLSRIEVGSRKGDAVDSFVGVIEHAGGNAVRRPSLRQWSILEYGGHLRDVPVSIREWMVSTSVLDVPVGTVLYRDEWIDLGFYAQEVVADVTEELGVLMYLCLHDVEENPHLLALADGV